MTEFYPVTPEGSPRPSVQLRFDYFNLRPNRPLTDEEMDTLQQQFPVFEDGTSTWQSDVWEQFTQPSCQSFTIITVESLLPSHQEHWQLAFQEGSLQVFRWLASLVKSPPELMQMMVTLKDGTNSRTGCLLPQAEVLQNGVFAFRRTDS